MENVKRHTSKVVEGSVAAKRGESYWTDEARKKHWMGSDFGYQLLFVFSDQEDKSPDNFIHLAQDLLEDEHYSEKAFNTITAVIDVCAMDELFGVDPRYQNLPEEVKHFWLERRHKIVRDFFVTALKDQSVRKWLVDNAEVTDEELNQDKAIDDLFSMAKDESLPDIVALLGARAWKEHRLEREAGVRELFAEWKEWFSKRVGDMISSGELLCNETEAMRRITAMGFVCKDSIISALHGFAGHADIKYDAIILSPEMLTVSKQRQFLFLSHEATHLLSGRTAICTEESWAMPQQERIGFQYRGTQAGDVRTFWLNEALTERLALKVIQEPVEENMNYVLEMELLDLFMTKGKKLISEKMLQQAYFENVTQPSGQSRMVETRALLKLVRESYADGFLVRLDQFIQQAGIQKAIDLMRAGQWETVQQRVKTQ